MTDQSKIPVPPKGEAGDRKNSLERAVESFDLRHFAPPPMPERLPSEDPRLARRGAASAPVAKAPVEDPVASPLPVEPAAPIAQPQPIPAASEAPMPELRPVEFRNFQHEVDRQRLLDEGLIVPEGKVTALLEEFRIVKRQLLAQLADLRRQGAGPSAQRVLVSSPHVGDGKTYCSLNLALSIAAERQGDVVLVDADFAKPSIPQILGLPDGTGLMDALIDPEVDVADLVLGTDIPGLWILPAGHTSSADSEFLSSARTPAVLDRLTEGWPGRIVIFDSPPALAASPAAELAKHVAQAVMIVRADRTGRGAVEDAVSLLSACPNLQLLLNAVSFSPSGRRFGSYYGNGG